MDKLIYIIIIISIYIFICTSGSLAYSDLDDAFRYNLGSLKKKAGFFFFFFFNFMSTYLIKKKNQMSK